MIELVSRGKFFVLTPTEDLPLKYNPLQTNESVIVYADSRTPIEALRETITDGYYTVREAAKLEKELCFWCYDNINKNMVAISAMETWLKLCKYPTA